MLCFLVFQYFSHSEKIVYVDNAKLFEGFYMTKEMKKIGEKEFNARKTILDSLYSKLQSGNIADAERKSLMQHFIQGKEELEMFNQNFSAQESSKIWSRIQGYVDDFSKEKNYDLIIGSENKQAVLYASERTDITNELLGYINKKYEGAQ
ncbi:OmpH family outer membrane protein [Flavobacterium humi]|uniref:OmpH family outer membrane protein n=1 Tax=Flavobacterium humi TaxID=2562683 RepID=UPI0029393099|nr:OmpH family outer membrane protein [Flavobacterium humi]